MVDGMYIEWSFISHSEWLADEQGLYTRHKYIVLADVLSLFMVYNYCRIFIRHTDRVDIFYVFPHERGSCCTAVAALLQQVR